MIRAILFLPVVLLCMAAVPATPVAVSAGPRSEPASLGRVPSVSEFEHMLQTNPVAAFEASLARLQRDVRGYTCVLQKQERLGGKLSEVDIIRHAVREEPFATTMHWEQGGGAAKATLYVRGENGGRMKVKSKYFITTNTDPNGVLPRNSSRYSIEDAGIHHGTLRTYRKWKTACDRGDLQVEYQGRKTVPELGGRECYVLQRTIPAGEVDNFRMADREPRSAKDFPNEAFTQVTIYFDCETWLQTGSVIQRADGSLMGAYWFRDVVVNPMFSPTQFTPAVLQ